MLKDLPKISIVTPSFNQAEFLEATIQSILAQNYPNLEYIIIDGGSTDRSLEIIKKYERYLHFWCSEPDAGQYDAINKGFAYSTGEIMAWLNSDDMYCLWALKTVASIMSELPEVEWLTTLQPGHWDWHGFCTGFSSISGYSKEAFLDGCYLPFGKKGTGWIQQESTFWKRSLWDKVGSCIRTDFKLAGDFDLWSRFFFYTELYATSSPLGGFRSQIAQKSRQIEQYVIEAEESLCNLRKFGWKPNIYRHILFHSKIHRIPKLSNIVMKNYGYTGQKVVRTQQERPDARWHIEKYRFYY